MTAIDLGELPADLADRRASGWWGMIGLIATEATLFAALLAGYLYLRVNADTWPLRPIEPPKLLLPGIGTALLVSSSVTLVAAEAARRDGRIGAGRRWMAATTLLGVGFLVELVIEFQDRTFGTDTNAYGSLIYAITSLHGAHVVVGLALLVYAQVRERRAAGGADRVVMPVSLYWHFVDAVWVVLFATLYLSERWS